MTKENKTGLDMPAAICALREIHDTVSTGMWNDAGSEYGGGTDYIRKDLHDAVTAENAALRARFRAIEGALLEYIAHDVDYCLINSLGDHTKSHRWIRATEALNAPGPGGRRDET